MNVLPLLMSSSYYLDQVKKCVTFIFSRKNGVLRPEGTGFFVAVNTEDGKHHAVYLVTAKHVLRDNGGSYLREFFYSLNTKKKAAQLTQIITANHKVLTHSDDNVDIAALLQYPDPSIFDYLYLSADYFTDGNILEEKGIREGSRVFFAGLFADFEGKYFYEPLVRFGNISLLTKDKTDISKRGEPRRLAHLYLVECQSLGGFSGSPVFFERERITKDKVYYSPEIYLGGIMKGHYRDIIEAHGIIRELNAAIALVTPCYLLHEILNTDDARKQREELAAQMEHAQ